MPTISKPSIKSLLIEIRVQGQTLSTATGFIAHSPLGPVLITNRHNVTGRHQETGKPLSPTGGLPDEVTIIHNRGNHLGEWVKQTESLFDSNKPRWIEHPTFGNQADFVALPLVQLDDVQLYTYDLSDTGTQIICCPSDTVSVVGFPFGIQAGGSFAVWTTGIIASEPSINFNNLPIFLIDCRSRTGQSGSPVIAYRSSGMVATEDGRSSIFSGPVTRFLGIYSGRINEQSDIGLVWKATALNELVSSIH